MPDEMEQPGLPASDEPAAPAPEGAEPASSEKLQKEERDRSLAKVKRIVANMPHNPGIYQMIGEDGVVLYVGKAKDLKKRVSSYFRKPQKGASPKTEVMVAKVRDIETTVVHSDIEALILETNLIKQLRPRYNVLMRDDKNYAYLKLTLEEEFPRLYPTRSMGTDRDRNRYYGPFFSVSALYDTLGFLKKTYPFRTCHGSINVVGPGRKPPFEVVQVETKNIPRTPCLLYHIKRCVAPCIGRVTREEYGDIIREVQKFLEGKKHELIDEVRAKMTEAAVAKQYEKAAKLRDKLQAFESLSSYSIVDRAKMTDEDVIAYATESGRAACVLFRIRAGRLVEKQNATFRIHPDVTEAGEILEAVLTQYYSDALDIPPTVLVPEEPRSRQPLEEFLGQRRGGSVRIKVPQRGTAHDMLGLARQNAAHVLEETRASWMSEGKKVEQALAELGARLGVEKLGRIECYDISHIQGTDKVASMVVFVDGMPAKKEYRRFEIRTLEHGVNDDFASLAEVLRRRLAYLLQEQEAQEKVREEIAAKAEEAAPPEEEGTKKKPAKKRKKKDDSFNAIPDLLLIDGGKGQLSSVVEVRDALGLQHVPVASIAKREEELFLPGQSEPIRLDPYSEALYLIQRIRDEAHRFAITYHRGVRSKRMVKSRLDDIPGLGPVQKKKLIDAFGSVAGIKGASEDAVRAVVGPRLASTLRDLL